MFGFFKLTVVWFLSFKVMPVFDLGLSSAVLHFKPKGG